MAWFVPTPWHEFTDFADDSTTQPSWLNGSNCSLSPVQLFHRCTWSRMTCWALKLQVWLWRNLTWLQWATSVISDTCSSWLQFMSKSAQAACQQSCMCMAALILVISGQRHAVFCVIGSLLGLHAPLLGWHAPRRDQLHRWPMSLCCLYNWYNWSKKSACQRWKTTAGGIKL